MDETVALFVTHDDKISEAIDKAALDQEDHPNRLEMVRRILKDWLIGSGYLPADEETPEQQD